MISISDLTYYIGGRAIFYKASLHIKPKDKIGLIGLNGTGKTTLLKIINKELAQDSGEVSKSNNCTIGFLNQDLPSYQSDDSILEVAMQAFRGVIALQHKIEKVLHDMEHNYTDKLVDKLNKLQQQFEVMEGYTVQSRAEEILEGIGFKTEDLTKPLKEFSGGWQMRVMLAKLLLEKPSLLMLDEPTNHLDLPSIEWIENYLRTYEGAVLVVSHDQQFLNNTSDSIAEVTSLKINYYAGNYDFYLKEKSLRNEIQQNAFENQQQKIKQTERFIERFRAKSTKARQVQSRVKGLERMEKVDEVIDDNIKVNFKFNFGQKSGRHVTQIENLSKSYGDLEILKNATGTIERGDKIALIGTNGKGKSTLLRIIAGTESHDGKCDEGYNVRPVFYAQHQLEALTLKNQILDELKQSGSNKTELQLRTILGCFLFTGDDVFKKIKVLSGGEKSRVALSKTLLSEANFLLLDEPTNHLDIQSVNILIQALQQYEGTFIIISHNRHFITQAANKIWWIEDQQIKEYPGPYEEYEWWSSKNPESVSSKVTSNQESPQKIKNQSVGHNHIDKDLSRLKNEMRTLEGEVESLEKNKGELEREMAKPEIYGDPNILSGVNQKFEKVSEQLENLTIQWQETGDQIEQLETSTAS